MRSTHRHTDTHNSPVGIGEGDEGELLGAVQDQVLCHLTEMSGTQGGPEQELRWNKHKHDVLGKRENISRQHSRGYLLTNKVPLACCVHAVQADATEVQLCRSRWGEFKIRRHFGPLGTINLDNRRRTSPQQLPVNVKRCPSHGTAATTNIPS